MAGEQLRVTEGKEEGKSLKVDADLQIGRAASDPEGRLGEDPLLSRRHARRPRTLALGDLVRVGQTVLQVTDASGEVPQATRVEAMPAIDAGEEAGEELV